MKQTNKHQLLGSTQQLFVQKTEEDEPSETAGRGRKNKQKQQNPFFVVVLFFSAEFSNHIIRFSC